MIPAPTFEDVLEHLKLNSSALICILFAPPFTKIGKESVIPRINYLHTRSGKDVHFYCAGYGAYWHRDDAPDMVNVGNIHDESGTSTPWAFSEILFAKFVDQLEEVTKWQYEGECQLLILNSQGSFSDCLLFNIDSMVADKAVQNASNLFESIVRYARAHSGHASVCRLSDKAGVRVSGDALSEALLAWLDKPLQGLWTKGRHYAVRDISK